MPELPTADKITRIAPEFSALRDCLADRVSNHISALPKDISAGSARVLLVRIDALDPSDPALVGLGDLAVAEAFEIAATEDNRNRIQLMSNYRRTLLAVAGLLPAHDPSQPD